MCGFIAQLVEHRTGIAEVTGSNPVEALNFFQASSFQLEVTGSNPVEALIFFQASSFQLLKIDRGFIVIDLSLRISGDFLSFGLLVFWGVFCHSAIQSFRILGIFWCSINP